MEFKLLNQDFRDTAFLDIHQQYDVLIISITQQGSRLVSNGDAWPRVADHVLVVGPPVRLNEVQAKFEA
ncbi:hypothetical protein ACFLZR_00345 [Candidatus Neomarinimicrobiota bacterium]